MRINKKELQKALEKVKPGLANKEIIEQATSFAFMGDRVYTYNDEISISHPVKDLDVEGAIKAQTLYSFIGKLKQEEIRIEEEENQIVIRAGRSKAGLLLEQEIKLPVKEEIGKIDDWKEVPEDFMEALSLCHQCSSSDFSRPVLTCVHITDKVVEASDSYQIIRYKIAEGFSDELDILIPAVAVRELIKYPVTKIAEKENWVHFKTDDGTIFSSRIIYDTFPDTEDHFEIDGEAFEFPEQSKEILEKALVFSKSAISAGEIPIVSIRLSGKKVKVESKNETGWFEEVAKIKYGGEPLSFNIGIEFLIQILKKEQKCEIGENKVMFSGENWKHLIVALMD